MGCLPYSQHARATATEVSDGNVTTTTYSDWWGYEITMVELLARRHNFRWLAIMFGVEIMNIFLSIVYDPPEDGLWGALEDSGNMSGLIGEKYKQWVEIIFIYVPEPRPGCVWRG